MQNPYDELYKQIDMKNMPFGYSWDYVVWRSNKLKGRLSKYIKKRGLILDVGGGFGLMAKFLPDFIDIPRDYINLDVSRTMLRSSPYPNILGVAENLPFRDKTFDYLVLSEVLEHVQNKVKTLKEAHRVLKPSGVLLLTTPRKGWIEDFQKSPFRLFMIVDYVIAHFKRCHSNLTIPKGISDAPSEESWLKMTLEEIGFVIIKQFRADNHVPWAKMGESKFWRWFSDHFVPEQRFGHCTVVVCKR